MRWISCNTDGQAFIDALTIAISATEIISKTKIIKDCVIYDDEGINESDINWNVVSKYVRDLTEYEVACNEFRLRKDEFKNNQYQNLAYKMHSMIIILISDKLSRRLMHLVQIQLPSFSHPFYRSYMI